MPLEQAGMVAYMTRTAQDLALRHLLPDPRLCPLPDPMTRLLARVTVMEREVICASTPLTGKAGHELGAAPTSSLTLKRTLPFRVLVGHGLGDLLARSHAPE